MTATNNLSLANCCLCCYFVLVLIEFRGEAGGLRFLFFCFTCGTRLVRAVQEVLGTDDVAVWSSDLNVKEPESLSHFTRHQVSE